MRDDLKPPPPSAAGYFRGVAQIALDDAARLAERVGQLEAELARRDATDSAAIADLKRAHEHAEKTIVELRAKLAELGA